MRLSKEALEKQLGEGQLDTCYLLISPDAFLLQDTRDAIWKVAHAKGFAARQIWEITSQSDWDQIKWETSNIDLFHRSFLEFRCKKPLDAVIGKKLQALLETLHAREVLPPMVVISYIQSYNKTQNNAWFQAIAVMSTLVVLDTPLGHHMSLWVKQQLHRVGLRLTSEAMIALLQCIEGNVPAAKQTIQKLALIYSAHPAPLTSEQISIILADQSTFELSHLTEAILQAEPSRCLRILKHLQMNNAPLALTLGYLLKMLRIVSGLRYGLDHQRSLSALFREYAVWTQQQPKFAQTVQRLHAEDIPILFEIAYQADQCIKGANSGSAWNALQILSLYLAGVRIPQAMVLSQY